MSMNNTSLEKFAELILKEVSKIDADSSSEKLIPYVDVSTAKDSKETSFETSFKATMVTMLIGVFVLLVGCITLFDGAMVPAMWQLTSVLWMMRCIHKD